MSGRIQDSRKSGTCVFESIVDWKEEEAEVGVSSERWVVGGGVRHGADGAMVVVRAGCPRFLSFGPWWELLEGELSFMNCNIMSSKVNWNIWQVTTRFKRSRRTLQDSYSITIWNAEGFNSFQSFFKSLEEYLKRVLSIRGPNYQAVVFLKSSYRTPETIFVAWDSNE